MASGDGSTAALQAMIPVEEVRLQTQAEELKQFRKYLIDRGTVTCLTKLYMFLMEKNRCNEDVGLEGVQEFLQNFRDESNPNAGEIRQLEDENVGLKAANAELEAKLGLLADEHTSMRRRNISRKYWSILAHDRKKEHLSGAKVWHAFLGSYVDRNTKVSPSARIMPEYCREEGDGAGPSLGHKHCIRRAAFVRWMATELEDRLLDWCEDLMSRFEDSNTRGEAPFQEGLLDAFCCASTYPVSPNPEVSMVKYLKTLPGEKDDVKSVKAKAYEDFERNILATLGEMGPPSAYPSKLLEFMQALLGKFGIMGEPLPLAEEEEAELKIWDPIQAPVIEENEAPAEA